MLHAKTKFLTLALLTLSTSILNGATGISCDVKNARAAGNGNGGTGVTINLPDYTANPTQPFVSTFGDQYVAQRSSYMEVMFPYGILTDIVTTSASGSGAQVTAASSSAKLEAGTTETGTAKIETKRNLRYIPGHESYAYFTVAFTGGTASNSTQWIGLFDDEDGFAIGYENTSFSILYRSNITGSVVNTTVASTAFNIDKLDGTGPSGITIDPTKINIFKISYGWLGVAPAIFSIMKNDGTWYPFHKIKLPNSLATPSLSTPVVPMRAEITKTAGSGATNLAILTSSWAAGQIGEPAPVNKRTFGTSVTGVSVSNSTEGPLISLESQSTFKTKTNKTTAELAYISISSDKQTTFKIYKNPSSLTGASFGQVDSNSSIYVDTSATAFSGGTTILGINVAANNSSTFNTTPGSFVIELLKDDQITITGLAQGGAATADIFIVYEELGA